MKTSSGERKSISCKGEVLMVSTGSRQGWWLQSQLWPRTWCSATFYSQLRSSPHCGWTIVLLLDTVKVKVLVTESCRVLCDCMDCSTQGSSVHGILQARIPEWVAIPFSGGSSSPRDLTQVSCIAGTFFTIWVTRGNLIRLSNFVSLQIPQELKIGSSLIPDVLSWHLISMHILYNNNIHLLSALSVQ